MIRWRGGVVRAVRKTWPGASELTVVVDAGIQETGDTSGEHDRNGDAPPREVRALAYTRLVGEPRPGDRVLLNTTALDMGLGTGGYAHVIAVPDRLPTDPPAGPGHLVKARYTPLQATVLGADEQDSPFHEVLRDADDLAGMPVVIADLHSALPAIVAGIRAGAGTGDATADATADATGDATANVTGDATATPRVAYVMTDGGALPLWLSRTVSGLSEAGWLTGTITVGQAFGGDHEAVTLHTGLLAARNVLGADIAVVAQGPGNLGTGTRWGFSGVACGEAVNASVMLGGRPVASLRISEADARPRHHGVSHHSLTAYGRVALTSADVVVPRLDGEFGEKVTGQAERLRGRHNLVTVPVDGLDGALRDVPVRLSTMGRGLDEDHAYFLAAAAAGRHAEALLHHDS
ncbi:DUF3866 family protein [Phytoactinopolyspora halotolerans]|uniref:DUF3866 family protein n=1 Tax=Phytoactinopolyspora halotolerans TaxID=1981512 RepID=A0A6L9SF11_9ACTN|nr:DUF3866 family protein [Phytoactinopolyspora halotolerans]NEE03178.1 DUF3866 family protein [Phytoactinopolyspora halotolerans]